MNREKYFTKSKDSKRQKVLDYMASVGVKMMKDEVGGLYFLKYGGSDLNNFYKMTKYRAKVMHGFIIVEFPDGYVFEDGREIMEAYTALEYLYNVINSGISDDDF